MSFASPYPDVDIPEVPVHRFLFGAFEDGGLDRPALVDASTSESVTYRQLLERVEAIAGALASRGLRTGDVVAIHAPNSPSFAAVLHGVLRAGGTATTINVLYTPDDIAHQLRDSAAGFLVTAETLLPAARAAANRVGIPAERVIVLDRVPGHPALQDLLDQQLAAPEPPIDPRTHTAVLPYSSGTTGRPKGVMLTHHNLVANVCQIAEPAGFTDDDRILAVLPFFHIYGLTALLNAALHRRATLVTMPRFDLADFLRAVERHRCTYLLIAPPIALALAKHPAVDAHDLSSVRAICSGAAPLDGALARTVAARLGCRVYQGYGMSELGPVSHTVGIDEDAPADSVGRPIANTVNKIVDPETGIEVALPADGRSAPGELWVKGPNVMAGYLGNAAATRATIDADGYLHTGDIAVVDADSRVYIVDRLKELIKYKGYQVPPAELEAVLLSHPLIADAAVIGVPDESGEEVPKAFVVRGPTGSQLSEHAVMCFVADRVAPHKKVRRVEFIDAIPKSAAGKILRKDLRAAHHDRVPARPAPEGPERFAAHD
ncbi:4-coumarate--CoA ligase family protein [Embleya sp. NBC_00888]|uniref:4-coumarate--CoA ligase family protein n=1 Tax=Embleya sp. NBC_00888 TaxID=2975960 RepID=UPI003863C495|nr:4-coumarate--CoA ligase family protein [Embleya sp. NBC_00888]